MLFSTNVLSPLDLLGFAGLILVFLSFVVRKWVWLYSFNMSGAVLLTVYALLRGNIVFTILELGIALFLAHRLINEVRSRRRRGIESAD